MDMGFTWPVGLICYHIRLRTKPTVTTGERVVYSVGRLGNWAFQPVAGFSFQGAHGFVDTTVLPKRLLVCSSSDLCSPACARDYLRGYFTLAMICQPPGSYSSLRAPVPYPQLRCFDLAPTLTTEAKRRGPGDRWKPRWVH